MALLSSDGTITQRKLKYVLYIRLLYNDIRYVTKINDIFTGRHKYRNAKIISYNRFYDQKLKILILNKLININIKNDNKIKSNEC